MSNINEECKRFIAEDAEGFQNFDFKHAQFLVELLPELNSGNITGTFQELEEKEKVADKLVTKIVHQRSQEFSSLLNKPMIYGEKYDSVKKTVSTSRKRIKRAKELLAKKNNNLKGYLYNSIYNKEILGILEKVEKCNNILIEVDALMKNESFYEMSDSLLSLREEIESFDSSLKDCAVIKHLHENERYKTQEASTLIQRFLRRFFFFFEFEIAIKSYTSKLDEASGFQFDKINLESPSNVLSDNLSRRFFAMNQVQTETFNDILISDYGVNLNSFAHFEMKLNQIRVILQSTPKNYVFDYIEDEYLLAEPEVFEDIHIVKYIGFNLEANQFNKYLEIICKAEDLLEKERFSSTKNLDITNLFLSIRSAEMTKVLPQVFSNYYGNLKRNVHDSLLLIQMFLLKNIWSSLKEEADQTIHDNEESNAGSVSLYHNLTMVQDYNSLLSLTSLGDFSSEKIFSVEKRRDLLSLYNYNPNTTRHLIQLFKEILMFQIIFTRKNILLQLILTNIKDSTKDLPIINIRETWKEFILELDFLFDKIFLLERINFELFNNPKESSVLYEVSFLPGSPFYDDNTAEKKPSQYYPHGSAAKRSLLDEFMIQKLIDLLGINFMYIPFILSVIHKPIMLITRQIEEVYQRTTIKELFQQKGTDISNYESEVASFFAEKITQFLLLFKLEYIKFINNIINTNKQVSLNPEKNIIPNDPKVRSKNITNIQENNKEEEKKEERKEISRENSIQIQSEDITPRQSNASIPSASSNTNITTKKDESNRTTILYQAVEKPPKRTKFDVKGSFLNLKYSFPALVQLSNNVNLLPSISVHLPLDKGSHILDLLSWSMNIAFNEMNAHLKRTAKGYLIENVFNEQSESEYMRFDEDISYYNQELKKEFCYLKKVETVSSNKEHMKLLKTKYKKYFSGETTISQERLMINEKHTLLIASSIENLEVFLRTCNHVFWNLLMKMPSNSILKTLSEKTQTALEKLDVPENANPSKAKDEVKDAVERLRGKIETSGVESFLIKFQTISATLKDPQDIYQSIPEDSGEVGILKYFYWFNQIFDLIKRCIICLKQELHLRAFAHLIRQGKRAKLTMENNHIELSGHNFTTLFREIFAIFDPLKNCISPKNMSIIFKDYLQIVSKIIKHSFLRSENISRPYIKTYLQNILSLEINLKKLDIFKEILERKDNPITNTKKFLGIFLLDEKELYNFVLKNRRKIKPKHLELYIKLQNQANEIRLDQKQEMERMNILNKLADLAKESSEQIKK